jgi:PKD repeat protein
MKSSVKILSMLLLIVLSYGCSKDEPIPIPLPTVNFTVAGGNLPAPATLTFTSTTTNVTNYLWDFGDNGTSTLPNPSRLYASGGVYTVKLTVTGPGGTNSITKTVNVGAALTKVKITKVTVINVPFTKPGGTAGWDNDGTGPDIFFQIQDINSTILLGSSPRIDNVTPSALPISWNLATPFEITNLTALRFIDLYDYDFAVADDYMSFVGFNMSTYTSGSNVYPSSVTNTQNGITVKLDLVWF